MISCQPLEKFVVTVSAALVIVKIRPFLQTRIWQMFDEQVQRLYQVIEKLEAQ